MSGRVVKSLLCFFVFLFLVIVPSFARIDAPHNTSRGINCSSCHNASGLFDSPFWNPAADPVEYNAICNSCHIQISTDDSGGSTDTDLYPGCNSAPHVATHSSATTSDNHGTWAVLCLDCHQPHANDQKMWYKNNADQLFLAKGTVTSYTPGEINATGPTSIYTYTGEITFKSPWTAATIINKTTSERRPLFFPASDYLAASCPLLNIDEANHTITVQGDVSPLYERSGFVQTDFAIEYGQAIQRYISGTFNDNTVTNQEVKFFDQVGAGSFAFDESGTGTDTISNGICQVCHTATSHWRSDGSLADHYSGENCTKACHKHTTGFSHGAGSGSAPSCATAIACHGTHESHVSHTGVAGLDCTGCHDINNYPKLKDSQELADTTICNNCHSSDGTARAKTYFIPGGWAATEGEASFCGSCHDGTPGNSKADGSGDNAYDIMGDDSTYGYFVTGHGKVSDNYARLSWQDTSANGNPAANQSCGACHNLTSQHFNNMTKRLKAGYENDLANSNCKQCHDPGSVATGNPAWYTTYAAYQNSAHSAEKCSGCHDVHGMSGANPAMTTANQESLCYQCHTDGMVKNFGVSGYTGRHDGGNNQSVLINTTANFPTANVNLVGWKISNKTDGSSGTITSHDATQITAALAGGMENDWDDNDAYHIAAVDDIQEAFSQAEKHDLGSSFNVGGNDFSLECVSCHNVHLVTGKHWDAEQGLSPVTRFTDNLEIWGDEPGEKTDDFAAIGSGTGGFYYKTAQGYSLGNTGLPFDQPAKYQPPKQGSGYDFEPGGDVLPDYTTFCLDCHSSRMADSVGAINWGQGISGGFPEPPGDGYSNWVNTSAPHGLNSANMSSYIDDSGTAGFWGTSGNPDVLFDMNNVTRGRHNGHFMRWPYDSADRGAGVNFVMACTDCHEAHGSSGPSMLRPAVNNSTPGTGTWNTFCNGCHYYYGGQHAGMSCATASCHEGYSIHRIKNNGGDGPTQLMLTSAGYEDDFVKPAFTPEIEMVSSHIGSNEMQVTFRSSQYGAGTPGIFGGSDLTGTLSKDDFWLFDKNENNPRTITNVTHIAGEMTATLTMSESVVEADLSTDTLAMQPASAWAWYDGGYNNFDSGAVPAQAVSAGPWPTTLTGPPPFNIQDALYGNMQLKLNGIIDDSNLIYITFAEGAYSSTGNDLQAGNFVLNCDGRNITSLVHTAGDSFAILTLNTLVDQSEVGVCTVAAAPGSIFDFYDNPAGTGAVTLTLPPEASVNDLVLRWDFNEESGTVVNSNDALGTQEDMHGVLTRNVVRVASTKPGAVAGDKAVKLDLVSDRGAVQLNYTINPDDGFPPATYRSGDAPVIVRETQYTDEFSFSVWIKPTALGCQEGKDLGLNSKLRRDVLTTQFWIKNWAIAIMRFSDDGDPINGDCIAEDSTHDVLRFWVAAGDPADMRCDPWGGSWPETVYPVSPSGYIQGTYLSPTDQAVCDNSATPTLPTNPKAHSFAQTETSASGALAYGGVALQPGVWQHVVGTWDGRYIRIYIDGQLAAQTDMGGTGNYVMLDDPHLWGGDLVGDGSLYRHVSSFFAAGARPIFSASGSPSGGAAYWNTNGFYDLGNLDYVGELDDVKYWKVALPLTTIQN